MAPPDDSLIEQRLRRLFSGHEAAEARRGTPASRPQGMKAEEVVTPVATAGPPPKLTLADLEGDTAGKPALLHAVRFVLGEQHFAVPLADLREVQHLPKLTRVPNSERDVLGLVNLRGSVVPIFDVRHRLSLDSAPPGPRARVLVFEEGGHCMGVITDAVVGAVQLPLPLREPPAGSSADMIEGLVEVDEVLVTVLRTSGLLRWGDVRE